MTPREFFGNQLASWLVHAQWHYRTLLGAAIECVVNLPDDIDELINELLLHHPVKPSQSAMSRHFKSSARLAGWFDHVSPTPAITRVNLKHFNPDRSLPADEATGMPPILVTTGDLADWLELSTPELEWFSGFWRTDASTTQPLKHYRYQTLQKRSGGKRLIEKPKPRLKRLQRKIHQSILNTSDTHAAVHGFCRGRSCLSHASVHTGKQYLMLFDITDCFQSIGFPKVQAVFIRMGYADKVARYLAALCTHRVYFDRPLLRQFSASQRQMLRQRHLPQGAPTSPALANAVLHRLDVRLSGLADSLKLDYSRYADDIALSGNEHRDWRFLEALIGGICLSEGVSLNYKKTRIQRAHQRQRLTGIVVNNKPNIDRRQFDTLKAILTNCARHGLDSQNRHNHPRFEAHLLGRIQYVKSLNPQRGEKLQQIFQRIESH